MKYAIQILGLANGEESPYEGQFLKKYVPEESILETTSNIREAKPFPSFLGAMEEWRRIDPKRPVRKDGKINRPLTAFSVTIATIPE